MRAPVVIAGLAGLAALAWLLAQRRRGSVGLESLDGSSLYAPEPVGFVDTLTNAVGDAATVAQGIGRMLTARGYRNNNPGNIRTLPASRAWNGQIRDDGGYGVYDTPANGTRALGRQLLAYERRGLRTVASIIRTWAPPIENNTGAYERHVSRLLRVAPDEVLDVRARLPELAAAIALHENGSRQPWGDAFNQWVYL